MIADKTYLIKICLLVLVAIICIFSTKGVNCETNVDGLTLKNLEENDEASFHLDASLRADENSDLRARLIRIRLLKSILKEELQDISRVLGDEQHLDEQESNGLYKKSVDSFDRNSNGAKNSLRSYLLKRGMKTVALGFGK
jgi:hypothetical protein